ncbi:hypothetical protein [Burkholderia sp. Ax-1735]|uniref:hypothetical protein n=1 Tax=unclassified Burkholderia TaxID=2613784 RepID=UPI0031F5534A
METHLHTGASASILFNSRSTAAGGLPATLDGLVEGFGPVGAAATHVPASRGTRDDAHRPHPKSTIHLATFMGRPDTSCNGSVACLPLRGKPLDATAPAFAIAIRSA